MYVHYYIHISIVITIIFLTIPGDCPETLPLNSDTIKRVNLKSKKDNNFYYLVILLITLTTK